MIGLVVLAVVRCVVSFNSTLPWNLSTFGPDMPGTSIEAAGTIVCDVLMLAVLALSLIDAMMRKVRVSMGLIVLWLIGAGFVVWHSFYSADAMRIGGNWVGATAMGLASLTLSSQPQRRRFILGAVIGLSIPLGIEAVQQVAIDHPATVRSYELNRNEVLERQGIAPGSASQMKFETRLYQSEATGALGLSNVFGSIVGALALAAGGVAISARPLRARRGWVLVLVVALAVVALALSKSRGAMLAFVVAGGAVVVCARWRPGWMGPVSMGLVIVGIAAVVVRGWAGPPESAEGERSLLFRAYYWQGAASMVVDSPVAGVGPGEFQQAYMKHKPSMSPEDPADPHNVFVAWLSMLGIGGAAWCVMLGSLFGLAASATWVGQSIDPAERQRRLLLGVVVGLLAFGFQYVVQLDMLWIDGAAMLVIGAICFVLIVAKVPEAWLDTPGARWGVVGACVMILLHGQIEMGLTNTMSSPVLFVMLGLGAARADRGAQRNGPTLGAIVAVACIIVLGIAGASRQWQAQAFAQAAMKHVGQSIHQGEPIEHPAVVALARAAQALPSDRRFVLMRLNIMRYYALIDLGPDGDRRLGELNEQFEALAASARSPHPQILRDWLAMNCSAWVKTNDNAWLRRIEQRLDELINRSPHDLGTFAEVGAFMEDRGQIELAGRLYRRALEIDANYQLDPDSRLSAQQRDRMERYLRGGPILDAPVGEAVP